MTATASAAPARVRAPFTSAGRLLRLEFRRNAMRWMLPVAGALFWLLTYRRSMALPPLWSARAMSMQGTSIAVFIPTVVGAAAWTAAREARRGLTDLLVGTPRPRWDRQIAAWAATTAWALAGYAACVGVLYGVTAHQATWGGPLWWPAAVGAASLPALSALGFAAGAALPSRFTPPLLAVGAFVAFEASLQLIHGGGSPWQVSPLVAGSWELGTFEGVATFYRYLPDLAIVQLIFLAGLTAALLGVLGLPAGAGGRWRRRSAAALLAAGVLVAATGVALAGTGRLDPHGMIAIPAVHDAADDRPVPYTPVCSHTAIPVCLHPAYAVYLSPVAAALDPVLATVAGLPGAPARITQAVAGFQQSSDNGVDLGFTRSAGSPSEYSIVLPDQVPGPTMTIGGSAAAVRAQAADGILASVIGRGSDPAHQAITAALLSTSDPSSGTPSAVDAAARRFAALPAAARHAWLAAHLTALRAGQVTLAQLP